jgi:hypothetical protein
MAIKPKKQWHTIKLQHVIHTKGIQTPTLDCSTSKLKGLQLKDAIQNYTKP